MASPGRPGGRFEAAARLDPLAGRWPTKLLGCATSLDDWATATEDSSTGRRIGPHVDSFDRLPYPTRHQGRQRLRLNLGPGPRYLLIGAQDIQQICRTLRLDLERHYPTPRTYAGTSRKGTRCAACASASNRGTGTSPRPNSCPTAGINQPP
ncbi:hypothetical protein [Streptomyces tailanensis]|uniref:hypothetical protein n=1 Tax=Streptomyces tailanensis TaxID=2569858 RepID=UPI00122E8320|nr:hypothetical protein [Streptomyces tailanensis]